MAIYRFCQRKWTILPFWTYPLSTERILSNMSTKGGSYHPLLVDFRYEASDSYDLALQDRYGSPLSIHWYQKRTSSPSSDVTMMSESRKMGFYRFLLKKGWFLKVSPKILGRNMQFSCGFLLNGYYIIHMKFEVHSTNIFGLGEKTNITRW